MEFLKKVSMILTKPSKFFDKIKSEKTVNSAFSFLLITSLVYLVATVILVSNGPLASLGATGIASVAVFSWVMTVLVMFVSAAVVFVFAKVLGGKGSYVEAYKSLVYGSLPSQLLGWLPFAGVLFSIWSLYLQTKGVSKLYKIGMFRSLIAVLSPSLIALALIIIFASALLTGMVPKII
ncbi:MAG: YIP1 family protein [Candidatus Aenigmarchaeota archaeon]|nr:YIP1 family protein [Candidatus Aenigmarchaeota archaeon]